ncbi:MAG: 50S ribosomal protein L5 [Candidatus Nanoarchaeia archaeon]|nr:50S ribosomal protein L5 [Candidatus Nanoarchaeia archaeon]
MNKMQQIRVEKITLNMGTGGPGEELEKALKLLNLLTGKKPVEAKSNKRIPTWGVRPGLSVGARVTIRGAEAIELLKRLLKSTANSLPETKFDNQGNFAFGVPEYIDVPGVKYDAGLGIRGFEVSVTLERPGFRIKRRRIRTKKVPVKHRITKEESITFMEKEFGIKVSKGEEE